MCNLFTNCRYSRANFKHACAIRPQNRRINQQTNVARSVRFFELTLFTSEFQACVCNPFATLLRYSRANLEPPCAIPPQNRRINQQTNISRSVRFFRINTSQANYCNFKHPCAIHAQHCAIHKLIVCIRL